MGDSIVEKLRGPQLEKADTGTPISPGLLWVIDGFNDTADRAIQKLSYVLETL